MVLQVTISRRKGDNRKVTHVLQKQTVHGYVLTKAKASAATARIALLIIVTVLATGSLPAVYGAAGVEVFHKGQRLQGSCTTAPLPPNLMETTNRSPLLPSWVTAVHTIRDGCGSQCTYVARHDCLHGSATPPIAYNYFWSTDVSLTNTIPPSLSADQCLHAFRWYQTFLRDANELIGQAVPNERDAERIVLKLLHDMRLAPYHGKGSADAAGALVSKFLDSAILDEVRVVVPVGACGGLSDCSCRW